MKFVTSLRAFPLSAVLLVFVPLAPAQVVLEGDLLRVGVNTSGGLIDNNYTAGIEVLPGGPDLLTPNAPFEFYAMGHAGQQEGAKFFNWLPGAVTTNQSTGTLLKTITTGSMADLRFEQTLSFERESSVINFSVKLLNAGSTALENIFYARGLDANPDYYLGADATTLVTNNVIAADGSRVTAWGPQTSWAISILTDSTIEHLASIRHDWSDSFADGFDFSSLLAPADAGNGDHSINMAWNIGTLAAGAEVTVNFQYQIHQVSSPEAVPENASTLLLAGLGIGTCCFARLSRRRGRSSA